MIAGKKLKTLALYFDVGEKKKEFSCFFTAVYAKKTNASRLSFYISASCTKLQIMSSRRSNAHDKTTTAVMHPQDLVIVNRTNTER